MKYCILLFFVLSICGVSSKSGGKESGPVRAPINLINPQGMTLSSRIIVPPGFVRVTNDVGLVTYFRNLTVKPANAPVLLFDGRLKNRQDVHAAVIKIDVGTRDLQQCADAVMRLRAEYLFRQKKYSDIHFTFTNGDVARYTKYAEGFRPVFKGNSLKWQKKAAVSYSYPIFRKYMDLVFSYAGTASLTKELASVPELKDIKPGDVFIRGGFPGHAVMVMDVAVHQQTGEKLFLISQSYMPAQEIHILKNPSDSKLSPWYRAANVTTVNTPEWQFMRSELKRFKTW